MKTGIPTDDLDWADAAESAERGYAWAQASALWQRAIDLCPDEPRRSRYQDGLVRCDAEAALDRELAGIAKRVLGIPTLETQKSDSLDFHDVAVWTLRDALRLAYKRGQEERQRP